MLRSCSCSLASLTCSALEALARYVSTEQPIQNNVYAVAAVAFAAVAAAVEQKPVNEMCADSMSCTHSSCP